jgi:HSP20 family molecular chaperone IbpA
MVPLIRGHAIVAEIDGQPIPPILIGNYWRNPVFVFRIGKFIFRRFIMVYTAYTTTYDPFYSLFNKFNRDFQEVKGWTYRIDREKGLGKVFINALGVNKDDIDITWKNGEKQGTVDFIVKGKTVIDEELKPFEFEVGFVSPLPVKKLHKKFENGLVILTLEFDKPVQPEIEVVEE